MVGETSKGDFVELRFSGYANGEIFDSNIEEDLKSLNPKGDVMKTVVVIGENMVPAGLDRALEGKEIGKEYEVSFGAKEGFGERKRELLKTIPLSAFSEQKVNPRPGMMFTLDNSLVKVVAVSGARVTTDFNNPLAGKALKYKFTIVRKVGDDKERAEALFRTFFRVVPEFSVSGEKVTVKAQKEMESVIGLFKDKFKDLMGKELVFEEGKDKGGEETSVEGDKKGKKDAEGEKRKQEEKNGEEKEGKGEEGIREEGKVKT